MPGKGYIEGKTTKVDLSLLAKLMGALVVYVGKTDGDGNVAGTTLVCSDLMTQPDFNNQGVVLLSGGFEGQSALINGSTLAGTVNAVTAFGGQIVTGVDFAIVSQFSKSLPTVSGAVVGNWQAGETDLVTIGANGASYKLHLVIVTIANLVGNISIRAYHMVNGVERRIFPIPAATTFTAAASAPAIPIWDTTGAITEALRITVQSDNAADNGQAVDYEYKLELM